MTITFQQTDTVATYAGPSSTGLVANGGGTINRLCLGSTPGSTLVTATMDAQARNLYAVSFDIPVPQYTLWTAGTWTIPLNVAQPNQCITWTSCYLLRLNSAGVFQQLLGSVTRIAMNLVTGGVKTIQVLGEASGTRAYYDRVLVVLGFTNNGTLPPYNIQVNKVTQVFGIVPDQLITSPYLS